MIGARAKGDFALVGRLRLRQKIVKQMDGVVEEIIIGLADPDVELAAQFRGQRTPVLLQNEPQIVFLPMLQNRAVDFPGLAVPQGLGIAVVAAGTECGIPGAPIAATQFPAVASAEDALELDLVAYCDARVAVDLAGAGPLEAVPVP